MTPEEQDFLDRKMANAEAVGMIFTGLLLVGVAIYGIYKLLFS